MVRVNRQCWRDNNLSLIAYLIIKIEDGIKAFRDRR